MSKQHIGIFGPGQSGKTTLAKSVSESMQKRHGFDSLVLDPNGEHWKASKFTTTDEEAFWPVVWKSERCLIVVEEATEMIARNKDLIGLFTRIRHKGHKLMVIGHNGTNLLPIMREQIHFLFLFRQPFASAKLWSDTMAEDRLIQATTLKQYEFLRCIQFGDTDGNNLIQRNKLNLK